MGQVESVWVSVDQCGSVWVGVSQFDTVWISMGQCGSVWVGVYGLIWLGVGQSVTWLTFLLKLHKYWDIIYI